MSDLVRRLRNYWPDDGDFGPTKLCREAADRIERLERENEELRNACLSDAMQATPLTPHGEAIAAGDGTLHGAIDYWQQQAFTMAAGQCIVTNGGLMADDHGHQFCDMERQRDEWKRKAEEYKAALNTANDSCRSAYQVANRAGAETDWENWKFALQKSLKEQHKVMYPEQYTEERRIHAHDAAIAAKGEA